ncbi:transcription-repair coupling factor [Candidatus Poribacteria bacterium]|nr:MAG: transcription-repair coupling factor [Candidatus Poribacteria bacterium]
MIEFLQNTDYYQKLIKCLKNGQSPPWIRGLPNASIAYFLTALIEDFPNKTILNVFPTHREAVQVMNEVESFQESIRSKNEDTTLKEKNLFLFPGWQNTIFEGISPSTNITVERIRCLHSLISKNDSVQASNSQSIPDQSVVFTTVRALSYKLPLQSTLSSACRTLQIGDEIDYTDFITFLYRSGYKQVELVEVKGEFAQRGDIVDIFPLTSDSPVRLDFFGDEIDEIRLFDPTSQVSTDQASSVVITPMSEICPGDISLANWKAETESMMKEVSNKPEFIDSIRYMTQTIQTFLDKIESKNISEIDDSPVNIDGIEAFLPMLYPETEMLTDYLPDDLIVLIIEPRWQAREVNQMYEQLNEIYDRRVEEGKLMTPVDNLVFSYDTIQEKTDNLLKISLSLASNTIEDSSANSLDEEITKEIEDLQFDIKPLGLGRGNYQMVFDQIRNWTNRKFLVNVFCETPQQAKRVYEMLIERDIPPEGIMVSVGFISEGFLSESQKFAVISENEIFGSRQRKAIPSKRHTSGAPLLSLIDMKPGDFVVHVSHGIALYEGIRRMDIDGQEQDFLILKYKGDDKLYVPTYQLDLVQKYVSNKDESYKPVLDHLGGKAWESKKGRAKAAIEEMAGELLKLYATRQANKGFSFPTEVPWEAEFEALFPFQETDDQLQAIEDVKADMEAIGPMDRLICGDVGYGKTEVALRAAFKAVMSEKQVALLCPTTILALQHYDTFEKRFNSFPIQVEMLNRFRNRKEIQTVKSKLEDGSVDIVIGTHSLLSDTVSFDNLGLLIVDEEHRFGVKHKEKIKQYKETVDVLTLTATPIPRTLHMSLVGIRDFSIINTPPANRLPIQTHVIPYNTKVIKDSINTELARDGQVFFVHNRVQDIGSFATNIQDLVPNARIAVAHGQMPERELENVMLEFVRHKYDILVCTMIIESGLDIPNVNTIMINRADAFGLAQLYQLRGRVGRADEQAFGYLFYPPDKPITEGAQKRLRVIEEFTDLGSGFKIALRDLEIRGAGNILGAQQHGHITKVGYELYCKLLDEAVKKLKGEKVEEDIETSINLPIEAFIPDDYIPESRQKISIYKKISAIKTVSEKQKLVDELQDRYGEIPEPVLMLLEISSIKQYCQKLGITAIVAGNEQIKVTFDDRNPKVDPTKFVEIIHNNPILQLKPPAQLMISIDNLNGRTLLKELQRVLTMFVEKTE